MMQTCCPSCATTFHITPEQLKQAQGQVRCGQCQQVFDALSTLATLPTLSTLPTMATAPAQGQAMADQAPPPTPEEQPLDAPADDDFIISLDDDVTDTLSAAPEDEQTASNTEHAAAIDDGNDVEDTDTDTADSATAQETAADTSAETSAEDALISVTAATTEVVETAAANEADAADEASAVAALKQDAAASATAVEPVEAVESTEPMESVESVEPAAPSTAVPPEQVSLLHEKPGATGARAWPWLLLSLLALLLLSAQTLLHFRSAALVLLPELRPVLQAGCDLLDCELTLPRRPEQLSIETSDLYPDTHNPEQLILTATLKNRAPFAQTLPHLELTLTDAFDQPLLRKIIAPADYLPTSAAPSDGFAARHELPLSLRLQPAAELRHSAAGYRLYLFYP